MLVSSALCLSALGCVPEAPASRPARGVEEPGLPPAAGLVAFTDLTDGPAYRRDRALSAYLGRGSGPGAPLGRVALGVLREVRAGRCGKLPLVDPAAWSSLLPSPTDQAGLAKDTRRARQTLAPACGRMGALLRHRINLMPDDMIYGALRPSGALLGMVRCDPDWQGTPPRLRIRSCVGTASLDKRPGVGILKAEIA